MEASRELWTFDFTAREAEPEVSIIIPAFGQVSATSNCLFALGQSLKMCSTSAEVILVDDCSPDSLVKHFEAVQGLRILRNEINLGFLKTCNLAVSQSKGRDIVLLNNDTLPVGRWLDHLVDFRASKPGALVVGARLISANGAMQESGGIIFKDGSGWNFGRGWSWDDPRCSYPREVDYCSGAALLVDGDLARRFGPFDERFTPAYYEDTDLCFEARRCGGTVWVEPRAVVVHLEGLSNGTDTSSGVKAFQTRNREVFVDKWRTVLEDQFSADAKFVWQARSRGSRRRVVVFDEEVPQGDRNAGALRMFYVMVMLRELGYEVTFCPRNGRRAEPHTRHLEDLGVEVLGPYQAYFDYLRAIRDSIAAVWIARVAVAQEVFSRVEAELSDVPIIYDTVDLHHVRLAREEALLGCDRNSESVKALELDFCQRSTVAVVVSEVERSYLSTVVTSPVRVLSMVHPTESASDVRVPDEPVAIFVGSFNHPPNSDAVLWFVRKVMPLILERKPNFVLRVVGENPSPEILKLRSASVEVLGWVHDIKSLLKSARVNVAPLRFGAGVKGKISHALGFGVPCVSTSIGIEGMDLRPGQDILVADQETDFADAVVSLLDDDKLWREFSENASRTADHLFGFEVGLERLRGIIEWQQEK
jgi:O-antigen biosynthesis protein